MLLLWDNWGDERGCDKGHWHAHTRGLPWGLSEVVRTVQVHCSRRGLLRRGLEFNVCTINKSAHTKKCLETYLIILIYVCVCIYIYIYIYIYIFSFYCCSQIVLIFMRKILWKKFFIKDFQKVFKGVDTLEEKWWKMHKWYSISTCWMTIFLYPSIFNWPLYISNENNWQMSVSFGRNISN